ncbi:MAG: extracellular solute-binding protein [Clostridiales bacterium]|nr:extracellular solute-binding protein [Clostridiales bacterium]
MKRSVFKKATCLLMAVLMFACMAAGCGNAVAGGGTEANEASGETAGEAAEGRGGDLLSFTYLRPVWQPATFVSGGAYEQALFDYANIEVDVQIIPVMEYDAKVKTVVAGGTLPDVMWASGPADPFWRDLENQGAFTSIDELLESHPNVKNNVSETVWNQMRNPDDGKIYFLPRSIASDVPFFTFYRKDWFDAQNIPEPTTIDELNAALETIKNAYPEAVPMTVGMGGFEWMFKDLGTSFGATVGGWVASADDPDTIIPAFLTEEQENYFFWLQDMRRDGLLDPEVGINPDVNHGKQKFMAGTAAAYPGGYPDFIEISAALAKTDPTAEVAIMAPLTGPTGVQGGTRTSYPVDRGMYFSSASDVTAEFFDFLEWWLTDATDFRRYGVEGEMYNVVEGKKVAIPEADRKDDYKTTQIEPLSFFGRIEEELDFEGTWKPAFVANGLEEKFEYWYDSFMAYCENRFPDYLSPTVLSPTSAEIGAQIWESTLSTAYGAVLLNVNGTREQYQEQADAWLSQGGQDIINEINAAQADKSKPTYGE